MSFDLRINNGDIAIGSNGDFAIVEDTEKLIQDILKLLMCRIGSNVFFPWYGSNISGSMVGQVLDETFRSEITRQQINSSLETLQKLQRQQAADGQKVTPGELLAAIQGISVERNSLDPTFYTIDVNVLTKGFKTLSATLDVSL